MDDHGKAEPPPPRPRGVASIAYMGPGNFATNIQAGTGHGLRTPRVALSANLVAMLFQALSSQDRDLTPENIVSTFSWAIGLTLLAACPCASMLLVAIATYAALRLQRSGFRSIENPFAAAVAVITARDIIVLVISPPRTGGVA